MAKYNLGIDFMTLNIKGLLLEPPRQKGGNLNRKNPRAQILRRVQKNGTNGGGV